VRDAVRRKVCANLLLVALGSQTRRLRLWLVQKQSKLYGFVAAIKARKRKIFRIRILLERALDSLQQTMRVVFRVPASLLSRDFMADLFV
jgi:hypothetical protein